MAHCSSDGHVAYIVWPRIVGSHKNLVCPLNVWCVRWWRSLNGFICEKAKSLPISLAKVPMIHQIAVGRKLELRWRYKGRPMWWPRNFSTTRLSGSRLSCRNSRRPGLGWCRRSIGERNWLFPSGYTAVQGCWMFSRSPDSHRPEMFYCNPMQLTCWQLKSPTCRLGCGNVGMAVGVNRELGGLETLMILYPATSTHNHSISDCSGDWSTSDHSNRSWTHVVRPWFLIRTDPASEKFGMTSLSAVVQWVSCRTMIKALFL